MPSGAWTSLVVQYGNQNQIWIVDQQIIDFLDALMSFLLFKIPTKCNVMDL